MNNNYEAFVKELCQDLITATGYEESRIYFKRAEDYPQTSGDRIFVEFVVTESSREVYGLKVQELYGSFQNGTEIAEMVQKVMEDLEKMKEAGFVDNAKTLEDYEKAKENLFIRPLNFDRNKDDLKNSVYRVIGDIALVLYMRVGVLDGGVTSFKVRKDIVESWNQDWEEVFDNALLNTYFLTPPRLFLREKLLFDPNYRGENFMNILCDCPIQKDATGNCLSNTERINGAISIFLPGVAARIGELMGNGFYMVFTSIHEVMIHSDCAEKIDVEELRENLKEVIEEAISEKEFLTLKIYHYNKESGEFSWE